MTDAMTGPNFRIFSDEEDAIKAARRYLFPYDGGEPVEVVVLDQGGEESRREAHPSLDMAYRITCAFNRQFDDDGLQHCAQVDRAALPIRVRPDRWDFTSEADPHFEMEIFAGEPSASRQCANSPSGSWHGSPGPGLSTGTGRVSKASDARAVSLSGA